MSQVGDAVEIIFSTNAGATVTADVYAPNGTLVTTADPVPESGTTPGAYPYVFVGSLPGIWRLVFTSTGTAIAVEEYTENFETATGPLPFATVSDYIELYGSLSPVREAVLRALLRRASQIVRDNYAVIDAQIASGKVPAGNVQLAVLNMARRVMMNPNGLRSETTGPFARAYDTTVANGLLQLSAEDSGLLIPPVGAAGKQKAGTIRVSGGLIPPAPPREVSYRARWTPW